MAARITHAQYDGATVEIVSWWMQEAESQGSTPTRTVPHPTKPGTFRVPTDEIKRQAEYLSELTGVTLVMPHTIWRAYKVMLAGRRQYHERHIGNAAATDANDRHAYFIQVMVDVQELLKDRIKVQVTAKSKNATTTETKIVTVASVFDVLSVEDTINDDDDILSYDPQLPVVGSGSPRFVPEDLPEESLAADWESLKADYSTTLEYVGNLWASTDDEDLPLDPIIAGFMTEAAVVLIQERENKIRQAREDLSLKYGRDFSHATALDKYSDPGFRDFQALSDLKRLHDRDDGQVVWPTPILKLSKRHVTDASPEEERNDELLLQLMIDQDLEMDQRKVWRDEISDEKLPEGYLDEVSRVLSLLGVRIQHHSDEPTDEPIEERIVPKDLEKDLNDIKLQLAFAAGVALKSARTAPGSHARAFSQLQKLSREHDDLGHEVSKRSASLIKEPNRIRLSLLWDLARLWVTEWPTLEMRQECVKRMWYGENFIDLERHYQLLMTGIPFDTVKPANDDDFLRKTNGSLCSRLSLAHLVIRQELGLEVLNQSPHIISLCYMHATLSEFGAYDRQGYGFQPNAHGGGGSQRPTVPGSKPVLADIEHLCRIHKQQYFGGDFPTDLDRVIKQLQLKAGHSPMNFAAAAPGRSKQLKVSLKINWEIQSSKEIELLRELIHSRSSLLDTTYKFDKLMQGEEPQAWKRKSNIEGQPIADFLKKLQPKIETTVDELNFDYLTPHYAAIALFRELDKLLFQIGWRIQEESGLHDIRPQSDAQWEMGDTKWWSYVLAMSVIRELQWALSVEKEMREGKVQMALLQTPCVDVAVGLLKKYGTEKGGSGFADVVKTPTLGKAGLA